MKAGIIAAWASSARPSARWIVRSWPWGERANPQAIDAITEKAALLTAESEFSHHRAVGLALELIGDRQGAEPLAALLTKPAMTGYVIYTVEDARQRDQASPGGTKRRANPPRVPSRIGPGPSALPLRGLRQHGSPDPDRIHEGPSRPLRSPRQGRSRPKRSVNAGFGKLSYQGHPRRCAGGITVSPEWLGPTGTQTAIPP